MPYKIPYFSFEKMNSDTGKELNLIFSELLNSKWYIMGRYLNDFENEFAEYIGVNHAIGVGNGFDALKISLEALDLKKDDEVILPSLTFVATLLAVIKAGLKPVLADVDPETCVLDYSSVKSLISPRTRAIIPVHLFGNPCDIPEILNHTKNKGIIVIEDYAQSVGAEFDGKKTGSFGQINGSSFYPTKTLGALGDGGIITTDDTELADKCRSLRNYGFTKKGHHKFLGNNSRLDELQAAFLSVKIPWLDIWNNERRSIAARYIDNLSGINGLKFPKYKNNTLPVFHIFSILCEKRDALRAHLKDAGIETLVHYDPPLHLQPSMSHLGYGKGNMPNAEKLAGTQLSLPIYPGLSNDKIDFICEMVYRFMEN